MGGGSGVGPLAELARAARARCRRARRWWWCAAPTRGCATQIEALPAAARRPASARSGFTHEVDVLLEACDVVVSKAGGLTCAEALVKGAPLVVFRPTPGQEVRNATLLETAGAAVHARHRRGGGARGGPPARR